MHNLGGYHKVMTLDNLTDGGQMTQLVLIILIKKTI
jgi:hypothetical protein